MAAAGTRELMEAIMSWNERTTGCTSTQRGGGPGSRLPGERAAGALVFLVWRVHACRRHDYAWKKTSVRRRR